MIHKVIDQEDFLRHVSEQLGMSGKSNRFVTLGAKTKKKTKEYGEVNKVSLVQYEMGSDYVSRKKKPHRDGENFKVKRRPYYQDFNDNGTVRELISDPNKKYICVWKNKIRKLKEVFVDNNGNILDDVTPLYENEDAPRYFKIENVWYVSANGQTIITEEYEEFKDFLDNI